MPVGRYLPVELVEHLAELDRRLGQLAEPVRAWLAGGFAVHYYTRHRVSRDVDIKWSHRILIPPDMQVFEIDMPGSAAGAHIVVVDGSFVDVFRSFPPDWEERSQEVHRFDNMVLHVIDPVDLAVSKVARFSERDREDIRALAEHGLIDPGTFAKRADEALDYYIGDLTFVRHNLADASEIIASVSGHTVEAETASTPEPDDLKDSRSNGSDPV